VDGHALGVHDESLRRGADVIKRVARDERERVFRRLRQHREVCRPDDVRVLDAIAQLAARGVHEHVVTDADVTERPKKAVAVPRDRTVAGFPRSRRVGQMSRSAAQRRAVVALHDGRRQSQPGNFEQCDEIAADVRIDRSGRCM
jgi:hypothetical protein